MSTVTRSTRATTAPIASSMTACRDVVRRRAGMDLVRVVAVAWVVAAQVVDQAVDPRAIVLLARRALDVRATVDRVQPVPADRAEIFAGMIVVPAAMTVAKRRCRCRS
jgi:hypothetical protein